MVTQNKVSRASSSQENNTTTPSAVRRLGSEYARRSSVDRPCQMQAPWLGQGITQAEHIRGLCRPVPVERPTPTPERCHERHPLDPRSVRPKIFESSTERVVSKIDPRVIIDPSTPRWIAHETSRHPVVPVKSWARHQETRAPKRKTWKKKTVSQKAPRKFSMLEVVLAAY